VAAHTPFKVLPQEHKTDGIFEELKDIQRKFEYLPAEQLEKVAKRRGLAVREVHAVASFYPHFHLSPPPKVMVRVCDDMTCHMRGATTNLQYLVQRFQGTDRQQLDIGTVSCLGRCDHAPSVAINGRYYDGFKPEEVIAAAEDMMVNNPKPTTLINDPPVRLACDPYAGERTYDTLRKLVETRNYDAVIAELKVAGLKGMGGAGFPTHLKWDIVRKQVSPEKYIVCNADESEPGTIKDRFIITHAPYLLVEGMVIAGLVCGARRGYIYIRHEYEEQEEILREELVHAANKGFIGKNILGSDLSYDLTIYVSPGGYVCGEESALLEAIEGKRSEPRNKPPFLATVGLWNQPTVVNNVETIVFATCIAAKGAQWFNALGKNGIPGPKFVGLSGDVAKPGIFEVPMGTTYRELIDKYCGGMEEGKALKGFAPSGPSSGYLPASMVDLPLDWQTLAKAGSMLGSGAIVICNEDRCMLDMALNATRFYRNESCGKCVPCRIGSQKLVDMLVGWTRGRFKASDMPLLQELNFAMAQASICGLGQIVPAPVESVLKHFREEVDEHITNGRCPANVCPIGDGS
jgi:NADH:ubiquinone oxidoreductase subunit F (NADH-binding)/NADH:ubiquinone oxidoreductase subunit E